MIKSRFLALGLAVIAAGRFVSLAAGQALPADAELLWQDDSAVAASTEPGEGTSLESKSMGAWGFDLTGMDLSIKPGDDFGRYVNGAWMKRTKIPEDKPRYVGFDILRDLSDLRVRRLMEEIQHAATTLPSEASVAQADRVKLAGLFTSYLDQAEADRKDVAPIQPMLAEIKAIGSARDMAEFMGRSQGRMPEVASPFHPFVSDDMKNPLYNTLVLGQGGLGLPDREYYLAPIYATQRERYQQYVGQMLEMVGWDDPKGSAEKIMALETKLAEAHWTQAENRNRDKTYNPMTTESLADFAPGFEWKTFLDAAGVGATDKVVVEQNTAMPRIAKIYGETLLATLQAWQAFSVADDAAPLLSARFNDAHFEFHGKFMNGTPKQRSRTKRAVAFCESAMGEAVGRDYVAKYFPPDARAKAEALVNDVRTAMRNRIEKVDWMSPQTRARALAKIDKLGVKIGYPDKWRDYSMLTVDPGDLFGNAARSRRFEYEYRVAKLGQKVNKLEWRMTPQTVNAYYSASSNEIVFPAAILQPPFFDPNADDAVNYGAIGSVIGHETTHGFDDQGRKTNGDGLLTDWWTPDDAKKFEAQAGRLGTQFEEFDFPTVPGSHINGKNTMGENIADLGGVLNGFDAYHLHLNGQPAPMLDGFSGDQRFFLGWTQLWRTLIRDAALKQQLGTDVHSPGMIRSFAPLRNVDGWYQAFDIKPADKEYVAPKDRVRIW